MPRVLTPAQVESFRERLCDLATRRFAEHGTAGVTLRGLARELGCSPMTPYRYFSDKQEILAAVRAAGFARFAERCEAAAASTADPLGRLAALGQAYLRFAIDEPHAYRIMFELAQPDEERYPELAKQGLRARQVQLDVVRDAAAAGLVEGDPVTVANLMWAGVHGAIVLAMAKKLHGRPDLEELCHAMMTTLLRGLRPGATQEPSP